ncbi:MAG: PEP-CTERM sorting domain-containing protein [Gammaproteobacteria bacterium]
MVVGVYGQALAIPVISGDGTETCVNGTPLGGGGCSITLIDDHNLWKQNGDADLDGAVWISYANTGVGGDTLAPLAGTTVIFTVIETFEANVGDMLDLNVWADDTAGVFIDSISLFSPNFSQNICADGTIGCEPDEFANISYTFNTSGTHSLSFDVYQVGTGTNPDVNPFGLLYSGTLTAVPEPSVLALLGLGLFGLGLARRKNK